MPRPGRQIIVEVLKPILKDRGFRKTAQMWRRPVGEFIQVFNLQASQWSDSYYFNAGLYILSLGSKELPAEHECDVRRRFNSFLQDELGGTDFLNMDTPMDEPIRANHITRLVLDAVSWLEATSSRQAILELIERTKTNQTEDPGVTVWKNAWIYAGVPLPPAPEPSNKVTLIAGEKQTTIDANDGPALNAWAKSLFK